tara:strand:+ start:317 stop:511 length:195 start_codon:yes stop_codon:yes gene_type:complete
MNTNVENIGDWLVGENCPHCEAEGPEEPYTSDSNVTEVIDYYQCLDCGGEWYQKMEYTTYKVLK